MMQKDINAARSFFDELSDELYSVLKRIWFKWKRTCVQAFMSHGK